MLVVNEANETLTVPDYHPAQADLLSQKDARLVCAALTAVTLTGTLAALNCSPDQHVVLHIKLNLNRTLTLWRAVCGAATAVVAPGSTPLTAGAPHEFVVYYDRSSTQVRGPKTKNKRLEQINNC